jgi:hypothetical protein
MLRAVGSISCGRRRMTLASRLAARDAKSVRTRARSSAPATGICSTSAARASSGHAIDRTRVRLARDRPRAANVPLRSRHRSRLVRACRSPAAPGARVETGARPRLGRPGRPEHSGPRPNVRRRRGHHRQVNTKSGGCAQRRSRVLRELVLQRSRRPDLRGEQRQPPSPRDDSPLPCAMTSP